MNAGLTTAPPPAARPAPQVGLQLVPLADCPALPWRNGGGLTRELLCWPSAEAWALRISVAEVARSGPFSAWPGVARCFCVLQGAGVALQLAASGPAHTLTPDSPPLAFDGALAPGCTLIEGPTLDLNLMARQGAGCAELARALPAQPWRSDAPLRAVFTLHGATLHGAAEAPLTLPPATLAWSADARGATWHLADTSPRGSDWWLAFSPHTP